MLIFLIFIISYKKKTQDKKRKKKNHCNFNDKKGICTRHINLENCVFIPFKNRRSRKRSNKRNN